MLSLELNPVTLAAFIRRKAGLHPAGFQVSSFQNRFELAARFPPHFWDDACVFFTQPLPS
jgi:hypothetical protein